MVLEKVEWDLKMTFATQDTVFACTLISPRSNMRMRVLDVCVLGLRLKYNPQTR